MISLTAVTAISCRSCDRKEPVRKHQGTIYKSGKDGVREKPWAVLDEFGDK